MIFLVVRQDNTEGPMVRTHGSPMA